VFGFFFQGKTKETGGTHLLKAHSTVRTFSMSAWPFSDSMAFCLLLLHNYIIMLFIIVLLIIFIHKSLLLWLSADDQGPRIKNYQQVSGHASRCGMHVRTPHRVRVAAACAHTCVNGGNRLRAD
jgi:hypothetical protein